MKKQISQLLIKEKKGQTTSKILSIILGVFGVVLFFAFITGSVDDIFPNWTATSAPSLIQTLMPLLAIIMIVVAGFGLVRSMSSYHLQKKSMNRKGFSVKPLTAIAVVVLGIILFFAVVFSSASDIFPDWATAGSQVPTLAVTLLPLLGLILLVVLGFSLVKNGS